MPLQLRFNSITTSFEGICHTTLLMVDVEILIIDKLKSKSLNPSVDCKRSKLRCRGFKS